MIALDFNDPILDCTAGTATLFELSSKCLELFRSQTKPAHQGYSGAFATLSFPRDSHYSISWNSHHHPPRPAT